MDAEKKMTIQDAADKGLLSQDVAEEKREQLKQLFPEVFTDGQIDFEQLRRIMGDWVEPGKERYGLNWPGKADCMKVIQAPSIATLKPARDESVDFDETENLFIEGDNLEVLKLLQKAYFGKIKMIYIDPPYNTGNEFIYPDKYQENLDTYLAYTGQVDDAGRKFSTNTDTGGRFHATWLNMMFPRLYLARNLMCDDGLIFISIDDGESGNLRALCDFVFGEENLVAQIAWEKRYTRSNNAKRFYSLKDSILAYRKSEALEFIKEKRTEKSDSNYSNPDDDPRGPWTTSSYVNPATKEQRPNLVYGIKNPFSGEVVNHPTHAWKHSQSECQKHAAENRLWWGKDGTAQYPRLKIYLADQTDGLVPIDLWDYKSSGTTDEGGQEIKELFGRAAFDTPKPTKLITKMLGIATDESSCDIVLDFFAGSCSTAHAVFRSNVEDGGNRRFIMVQLPELCPKDSEASKEGFENIADIGKERIRRAAKRIKDQYDGELDLGDAGHQDLGFKVFKLDRSNFAVWDGDADKIDELAKQLELHVDHIDQASSPEDILYELLLKAGFKLSTKVEKRTMAGKDVYAVADGALLVCLDKDITPELIDALADADPLQVICLDEGFKGNDQLKTNAVQTFKSRAKEDEEAIVFRTV